MLGWAGRSADHLSCVKNSERAGGELSEGFFFLTLKQQCSQFHVREIGSARQCGQSENLVLSVLLKQ